MMKDGKLKLDAAIALIGQVPCGLNSGPIVKYSGQAIKYVPQSSIPGSTTARKSTFNSNFPQQPSSASSIGSLPIVRRFPLPHHNISPR